MRYASKTSVPVDRSKAEIEKLLSRYGASRFASGWEAAGATIMFEMKGRRIRFELPLPAKVDLRTKTGRVKSPDAVDREWEQACRQRWRALALVIKAKLEAVESKISEFEDEFLSYIVIPGSGETIGETLKPQIATAYETGKKLPPLLAR